mmetsp:Transcript_6836/g.7542  ORF Transcript_6836/g.7542 Transcript_6836/m.7542 type:complete len:92 (-) Transcript_6836:104-379(-)
MKHRRPPSIQSQYQRIESKDNLSPPRTIRDFKKKTTRKSYCGWAAAAATMCIRIIYIRSTSHTQSRNNVRKLKRTPMKHLQRKRREEKKEE